MTEIFRKPHLIVVNQNNYYTAFDEDHTTKDILMYLIDSGSPKEDLIDILESLVRKFEL